MVVIVRPQFVDLGFSTINSLDEGSGISTTATRIKKPADGVYWRSPNHVFDENTAVGVMIRQSQKLDAVVDKKFSHDWDPTSTTK